MITEKAKADKGIKEKLKEKLFYGSLIMLIYFFICVSILAAIK